MTNWKKVLSLLFNTSYSGIETGSLEIENGRLRHALKFYADEDNYWNEDAIGEEYEYCPIQDDGGEKAQEALKE